MSPKAWPVVAASCLALLAPPAPGAGQQWGGTPTARPEITGLSAATLERSGRLVVAGTGFGAGQHGRVLVDGLPAPVAEWSDSSIHAYVPEGAGPGEVGVQVETAAGTTAPELLQVTARQQQGQVRWRFTCGSRPFWHRPGIGPDGTIYAQDTHGLVYAIAPDGALRWIVDTGDQGGEGPVVVGQDGTIYAGANPLGHAVEIWALEPSGAVRWIFHEPDGGQGLIAGPGVGPDGRIYAVTDYGGPGAIALAPADGSVVWSNPGDPAFGEHGQLGIEIAFAVDRFYVAFDETALNAIALLYGLELNGNQRFAVGRPRDNAQPVVGPDGTVYVPTHGLSAYSPDGDLLWTALGSGTNTITAPDVGPDGTVYVARNVDDLWALAPDGTPVWTTEGEGWLDGPVASPDGRLVLTGGFTFGETGTFQAFDAADGAPLWTEVLEGDNGEAVSPATRPIFAPDGDTAYAGARLATNQESCYLYALDTSGATTIFADSFEAGDMGRWSDRVTG